MKIYHWIGVTVLAFAFAFLAFQHVITASTWLDVRRLEISDGAQVEDLKVNYERNLNHDFEGAWWVQIFKVNDDGTMQSVKTTQVTQHDYKAAAVINNPMSFEWFVGERINLSCGKYLLEVHWTVNRNSWLLKRNVVRSANFSIMGGNGVCATS